jgi:hypothetical protein
MLATDNNDDDGNNNNFAGVVIKNGHELQNQLNDH